MKQLNIMLLKSKISFYQLAINLLSRKYWIPLATKQLKAIIELRNY